MRAKTIIAIVLAILLVIFSLQNTKPVVIQFLQWTKEISTVLLIIGTFALGVIVGILVSLKKPKAKTATKVSGVKEIEDKSKVYSSEGR